MSDDGCGCGSAPRRSDDEESVMKRLVWSAILSGLLVSGTLVLSVAPASATTTCVKFGSLTIQNGRYVVQNNVWGADTTQCIDTTSAGFTVTRADHNKPTN